MEVKIFREISYFSPYLRTLYNVWPLLNHMKMRAWVYFYDSQVQIYALSLAVKITNNNDLHLVVWRRERSDVHFRGLCLVKSLEGKIDRRHCAKNAPRLSRLIGSLAWFRALSNPEIYGHFTSSKAEFNKPISSHLKVKK